MKDHERVDGGDWEAVRRRDALARADARRDDEAAREDVLHTYLAHREHLEPQTPEGTERLRFLLEHVPRTTTGLEDVFARAAAVALDADVADRALIAAAAYALQRSDSETAFVRLRDALRRRRGSNTTLERSACINLARALQVENRNTEALLVARRAVSLAVSENDPHGTIAARCVLAAALVDLGELARAITVTDSIGVLLPEGDDAQSIAVRAILARLRADIAHRDGRLDEAIWRLEVQFARENSHDAARRVEHQKHRARMLLEAGRTGAASHAVRLARAATPDGGRKDAYFAVIEAQIAVAEDDIVAARELARRAFDDLAALADTPGPHRFWTGKLADVFTRLGDVDRARRCLEILATERLDQVARVDRSARDIPELTGEISPEDRLILRHARERALIESRDTLAAFASLLAPAIRDGDVRALTLVAADDDMIRVCASCARVAGRDGRWLPLGHMIPESGAIRATHGMCPDCVADSATPLTT